MDLSKRVAKHVKQFEFFDPLCQERAKEASLGHEYLEMLVVIENKTDTRDLHDHSELRKLSVCRETISIAEMGGGYRLILKNGELLVPKSRQPMISNLQDDDLNAKHRIFWP